MKYLRKNENEHQYSSGIPVPLQPVGGVARWNGEKLTFYGMGQGIYPQLTGLARGLDIPEANIRFINKWNGGTFGGAMAAARLNPWIAYIARQMQGHGADGAKNVWQLCLGH